MMFQRAAPELNGLGVTTSTSLVEHVVEGLDPLRVALADGDHDDRVLGDAAVGLLVPVLGDEFAFFDQPFHVAGLGEVDDRGGLAGDDRAALVAGGAEGVAEADALAFGGLFEGRLEGFLVDGFGGGVADHVELAAGAELESGARAAVAPPPHPATTAMSQRKERDREAAFTLRRRVTLRAFRIEAFLPLRLVS